jgi:hypothetical protein
VRQEVRNLQVLQMAEAAGGEAGAAAGPGNVGGGGSEAAAEGVGAREETERLKGPAGSRRGTARS